MAHRLPAPKPLQFQAEFSVTPVLRVRIADPLVATTALKVVRKPLLAQANGVGGIWMFWNLPNASLRAIFDAAVSHTVNTPERRIW